MGKVIQAETNNTLLLAVVLAAQVSQKVEILTEMRLKRKSAKKVKRITLKAQKQKAATPHQQGNLSILTIAVNP